MKKNLGFLLGIFLFLKGFAQNPVITNDTTYQNDQPRVVVFNSSPNSYNSKKKLKEDLNLAKINIFSIFSGDLAMHYERKLGEYFSVEVGPGITLRNFLLAAINNDDYNTFGTYDDEREYRLGYSFNAGIRFYPSGAMEEFYFMPDIRIRRYNSVYTPYLTLSQFKEHITMNDYKLNIGYVNYIDNNIILDYYIGIGIRNKTSMTYSIEESYDPNTGYYYYNEGLIRKNSLVPALTLGLKFGFSF